MSEMEPEQDDTYQGYSVDAENQPQGTDDSTAGSRGLDDPLEEGYSPPETWSAAQGYGNTGEEERAGETLEMRLEQEVPEPDPYVEAAREADDLDDGEVGDERSGRLVAPDEGLGQDIDPAIDQQMVGTDVGIDGAGASAEEAAMHEVDPDR